MTAWLIAVSFIAGSLVTFALLERYVGRRLHRISQRLEGTTAGEALEAAQPRRRVRVLVHQFEEPFPKNVFEVDVDHVLDELMEMSATSAGGFRDQSLVPGDALELQLLIGDLDVARLAIVRARGAPDDAGALVEEWWNLVAKSQQGITRPEVRA